MLGNSWFLLSCSFLSHLRITLGNTHFVQGCCYSMWSAACQQLSSEWSWCWDFCCTKHLGILAVAVACFNSLVMCTQGDQGRAGVPGDIGFQGDKVIIFLFSVILFPLHKQWPPVFSAHPLGAGISCILLSGSPAWIVPIWAMLCLSKIHVRIWIL